MTTPGVVTSFLVHAEGEVGPFWRVLVFDDEVAMFAYSEAQDAALGVAAVRDFAAITKSWRYETEPDCHDAGTILFHREGFGVGVVAHEMTHAALAFARREGFAMDAAIGDSTSTRACANEERFCNVIGNLCAQFWREWYAALDAERDAA